MNDAATHADESHSALACACGACVAASERFAYQQTVLRELTELSLRVGRALCGEVEAARQDAPGDETPPRRSTADPGLAMSRIARSVRQNLALEARFADDAQATEGRRVDHAAQRKAEAIRQHQAKRAADHARKVDVRDAVEILIDFEAPDEAGAELLLDRLEDLMDPDETARFADAPITEWIAAICQDLGLAPGWDLWSGQDWAIEDAVTRPDSPFARRATQVPPPGRSPDWGAGSGGSPQTGSPRRTPESPEAHEPPGG